MERKYRYLGYFMAALLPLVFFGFYRTYFEKFPQFSERIKVYDHLHAFIATTWICMLIAQPLFIAHRNYRAHRLLGRASYVIFPLLILSFVPRVLVILQGENKQDLFFPLADSCLLISFYVLAIRNKKNSGRHMRYFIASALVFLGPTLGRIGYFWMNWPPLTTQHVQYALIYGVLLLLFFYDGRSLQKARPYLVAAGLFMMHQVTYYLVFL